MHKDTKKLLRQLEAQGFTTRLTRAGHTTVYRDGKRITTISGSASDPRSLTNAIAQAKRAGFNPHQKK